MRIKTKSIVARGAVVLALGSVAALGVAWTKGTHPVEEATCRQADCWASGLTWHTDLEQAKAEARASGKPILSLRLLGRLDEELSCANSRFFRTMLYPDPRVSRVLREQFVLHWESVRPAPKLTVEYADGRKIVTTVTGQSVHYVLDSEGRVVDAIPGVYSPLAFLRALEPARQQALAVAGLDLLHYAGSMVAWHGGAPVDFVEVAAKDASDGVSRLWRRAGAPRAVRADLAVSKSMAESRLVATVAGVAPGRVAPDEPELALAGERDEAARLGDAHIDEARLGEESLAVMRDKLGIVPRPMIEKLERSIARDTAFGERFLHPRIRKQLGQEPYGANLKGLDTWIYATVFRSPLDDPWYGLVDPDAYAALAGNGLVIPQR